MADIDVTELMTDPDFVDDITHIGRGAAVNSKGESIVSDDCGVQTVGCVQPASGQVLLRIPEALRLMNVKSFWIKGEIVTCEPGQYPDVLVFKGKRYSVQQVFDWSNFGEGYSEGVCIAERPAP